MRLYNIFIICQNFQQHSKHISYIYNILMVDNKHLYRFIS